MQILHGRPHRVVHAKIHGTLALPFRGFETEQGRRMPEENLLLIAFHFPPYAEVGSKRWSKLSKYLARSGVRIHVLTVDWGPESDALMHDVRSERITIERVSCRGFHRWRRHIYADGVPGRIMKRVRRSFLRFVDAHGWGDDARFWGNTLLPAGIRAIDSGFTTVVATGAPFYSCVWASRLKAMRPGIRLIQEFRDPWADLPTVIEGPAKTRNRIRHLEQELTSNADLIVTVTEALSGIVGAGHPGCEVITVRNGFDPEDFSVTPVRRPRPFTLLHGGNLFLGRKRPLIELLEVVREIHPEMPELSIVSYGGFPGDVRERFRDLIECGALVVRPRVSGTEIAAHMDDAFACLHFNASNVPFALSTKIYEYGYAGRPVISLNFGGASADFVVEHNLGWNADAADRVSIAETLREAYRLWQRDPSAISEPINLDAYAYEAIAGRYRSLLG